MNLQSSVYVVSSTDADAIQTAASDLAASGAEQVVVLSAADITNLIAEIQQISHEGPNMLWAHGYNQPLIYPTVGALYGALGGTDVWTLNAQFGG